MKREISVHSHRCDVSVLGFRTRGFLLTHPESQAWRIVIDVPDSGVDEVLNSIRHSRPVCVDVFVKNTEYPAVVRVIRVTRLDVDHWEASLLGIGPCPV